MVPLRRNRDFVLLQAGQLLSTLGTGATTIAYPLLVLAVTHSPAKAAGRVTFWQIPVVAFVEGAGSVLFAAAETGALRGVVPLSQLPAAAGAQEARSAAARLGGPPL